MCTFFFFFFFFCSSRHLCRLSAPVATLQLRLTPPTLAPSPHPPHPYSLSRVESSLPTQTDSCTNSLHCKKLNHTVFLFLWVFFFPQLIFVFLNSIVINIVQNVTKKNVHLVFCVFFYTRQAEADYYVYRRSSPPPPSSSPSLLLPLSLTSCFHPQLFLPPSRSHLLTPPRSGRPDERLVRPKQTGFKIDLYIFIYAYIKKGGGGGRREEEEGGAGAT